MHKQEFINGLKKVRHLLPKQTVKTIRGQAIAGDIQGAMKGLISSLNKADAMEMVHRQTNIIKKYYDDVDYQGQLGLSLKESHRLKRGASIG